MGFTPQLEPFASIGLVLLLVVFTAAAILVVAHALGPARHGPVKDAPYESGMPVSFDTQRRFNIRFYVVAMLFMLFDVEVIFLWPWATVFHKSVVEKATFAIAPGVEVGKGFLLAGMGLFFALLLFGLVYEWKKGAFEWD